MKIWNTKISLSYFVSKNTLTYEFDYFNHKNSRSWHRSIACHRSCVYFKVVHVFTLIKIEIKIKIEKCVLHKQISETTSYAFMQLYLVRHWWVRNWWFNVYFDSYFIFRLFQANYHIKICVKWVKWLLFIAKLHVIRLHVKCDMVILVLYYANIFRHYIQTILQVYRACRST